MAGASTASRRGLHAYRLLRRNFSRGYRQLRDWRPFQPQWMARYVCCRRTARAVARGGASRRHGAFALEGERAGRAFLGDLASVCGAIFKSVAAPHYPQRFVHAGVHLRAVGRHGVRAFRSNDTRGSGRARWSCGRTARFPRHYACSIRNHSGLLADAVAGRAAGPPRRARVLFHADADLHRAYLWESFLHGARGAAAVLCVLVFSWAWRREFRGVYVVAPGTISDGMPRQRVCVFYVDSAFWRRGDHFLSRRRRAALRLARHSYRYDFAGFCGGLAADTLWCGNARTSAARMSGLNRKSKEEHGHR